MKSFLTIALATLSLSSFAGVLGTPDQDPVVAYTRQLFNDGDLPTAGFLLNNKFNCVMMSAVKGDFKKEDMGDVSFRRIGKMFTSDDLSDELFFVGDANNSDELVASTIGEDEEGNKAPSYAAIKVNEDENVLVLEASMLVSNKNLSAEQQEELAAKYVAPLANLLSSDADESEGVVVTGYAVCSIK